jgi:4-hydroxy-3-polyprenylbenzoate decarboxylase
MAELPARNLKAFIALLEQAGDLVRVREPVDPVLEAGEIADRFVKAGEGPALLFEDPRPGRWSERAGRTTCAATADGRPVPLAMNLFASRRRMAWALGCESLEEAVARVREPLELAPPEGLWEKLKLLGKARDWSAGMPRSVAGGPCQEVVVRGEELDRRGILDLMPVLTTWPQDGGPFITLPLVVTRNPETGRRNIGMYRMQVFDGRTTGMHWQLHKTGADHYRTSERRGERLPVCVALGGPPSLTYAATAPLPPEIDESMFAGFLQGAPIAWTKALTCDLEVPAEADFVIEGYVDPGERRREGPFGDHTGFYTLPEEFPVFHVTAITSRRDPVYPATIVGVPPMEDKWLGWATERLFLPLMQKPLPEVVDYHLPPEACFHNLAVVAIRKQYPGHARKVCHALWGMGQMMFCKTIVVVDADVDVHDPAGVLWRVTNSIDPKRDTFFVEGPVDHLDHAVNVQFLGGKMGIDATAKWEGEDGFRREWPPIVRMDDAVRSDVAERWRDLLALAGRAK